MHTTIPWHGNHPVDLVVDESRAAGLKQASGEFASLTLNHRQLCDLELLVSGAFAPLTGYMNRAAWQSVLNDLRLPDGTLWPMPITLDVPATLTEKLSGGARLALRDTEGFMVAVVEVSEVWERDLKAEAEAVWGTTDRTHPGVRALFEESAPFCVGGCVLGIQIPQHYDFENLWDTPQELRHLFEKMGWRRVVAFLTSQPMHRLQREIVMRAARDTGANILLHPAVGLTKPGDLSYYARVHCYQAVRRHFPHNLALLSLLPLAMRMAGPREALWHAIVHQNYGCSHFIVGPDYAAPPRGDGGGRFYDPYAAQAFVREHQQELAIRMVPVEELHYSPAQRRHVPESELRAAGEEGIRFGHAELRRHLEEGREVPEWFSYPEVITELRKVCPPRSRKGFTLFFTGLSGSGKSTLARIIYAKLIEHGGRPVTLLDGDVVRLNLSSELGFSKAHRDLNVRRIGFVANEITRNGGVAICAPIAPYTATRRAVRELVEAHGAFFEIHVATPLDVCESRDRKGLYAKARKGIIPEFTGISDPYETPERPEIRIDTSDLTPMEAAQEIFLHLLREGYLEVGG